MEKMNFLDAYEANARAANTPSTSFDPNLSKPQETEDFGEFSNEVSNGIIEPEFKVDVSTILRDIDTDSEDIALVRKPDGKLEWDESGKSDNERYIIQGIMEGRINIDDIDDDDAPYALAAISHGMFGNKSDYNGTLLSNVMKGWNKAQSKWNDGYNPETRTWDAKVVLREFKKAWDYTVEKSAAKKNAMMNANAIADGWIKEGDRPYFSEDDSDEALDYRYGIASKRLGSMENIEKWDDAFARSTGTGKGIDMSLIGERGWKDPALFGVRDLWENYSASVNRGLKTLGSAIIGDDVGMVENGVVFHNAGQEGASDGFILRRAAEELGVKSGDYGALVKAVYANDESHSVKLKNGTIVHVNEKNKDGNTAAHLWIESGNSVYQKMQTCELFEKQQTDTLGIRRMSHAIDLLCGNKDASEGVAIYLAGRDTNALNLDNGDEDGLRTWANNYLAEDGDKAARWHTVQTAFEAIRNMKQTEGFFGSDGLGRTTAAVANVGVRFLDKVGDMGAGAWREGTYWIERGIDRIGGETPEQREKAHREHMIHQQILGLVGGNWNGEGTVLEYGADKILEFKAFELVFAARASALLTPVAKIPVAKKGIDFLTKSRVATRAKHLSKAEELGGRIDDLCDNLITKTDFAGAEAANMDMAMSLRAAKNAQMKHIVDTVGSETGAKIADACVKILNNAPNFFTVYASSVSDMEKVDADRLGAMMDKNGTGFDDKLWDKATDIIKGRGVASAALLTDLGRFLKVAKRGSAGNPDLANALRYVDDTMMAAVKAKNTSKLEAILGGFKYAKAELVEGTMRPMFRMGFKMGVAEQLGQNVEDSALGLGTWGDIDKGVMLAGGTTGAEFAMTGALMKTLPTLKHGTEAAMYYLHELNVARQDARPEDIMSSYIVKNHPESVLTTLDASEHKGEAEAAYKLRWGEYIRARLSGDEASLAEWRRKNVEMFGENGAKVFDDLFANIRYSDASKIASSLNETKGVKLNLESAKKLLSAGGYKVSGEKVLDNGDIELNAGLTFAETADGKSKLFTDMKFLIHNGKLYIKADNGTYNPSYAKSCVAEIEAGRASPDIIQKWNNLTPEQKDSIRAGNDIDGILGDSRWQTGGWFGGKAEIDNADAVDNLHDISDPKLYDGISVFAGGQYKVFSFRHEMLGHAAIEAMRKAKILKDEDIKALEDAFGKDWEETLSDIAAETAGIRDAELLKSLLGEQKGGLVAGLKHRAATFLRAIKVMKEAAGTPETFNVGKFFESCVKQAHETYKLHETQRKAVELAQKQADELATKAKAELTKARKEAEELYKKNLEERKRTGQERAVQIAKQRDVIFDVDKKIEDIALGFDDIDKFNANFDTKIEQLKRDTIQQLKRLGMDKGEIGAFVEDHLLKAVEEVRREVSEVLSEHKSERERVAAAEQAAKEAEEKAKAEAKVKLDAFHEQQRLDALKKKTGEKYAKRLSVAKNTADEILESVFKFLREGTDVGKFDRQCKALMKRFKARTAGFSSEITKPLHDMLKENIYQSRKAMEYKADGLREQEEARKKKEAEAKKKAKEKAAAELKAKKEVEKALREAKKKETEKSRKAEAEAKERAKKAEELAIGIQLIQMGLPVPNKNVIAGLKGDALMKKREFMRQAGYYYSKDLDCWVNKKNAPEAFKKAATETVKQSVDEIVAVKKMMKKNGVAPQSQEMILDIINEASGRKTEEDPKTAEPTQPTPSGGEQSQKKKADEKALREMEDMIREVGAEQGWDEKEINRQIKLMRARGVKAAVDTAPEVKPVAAKPQEEAKPAEPVPPAKPLANVKDEKIWWRKQLTPQERLGLGVVYVDGNPWSIVYCPGEVISGNEQFNLTKGELPDGAEIRPFSKKAFDAALDRMSDEDGYDTNREVTGAIENTPFFDYRLRRLNAQNRKETIERNKKEREEALLAQAQQEALKAKETARDQIMRLALEKHKIREQMRMTPLTEAERNKLTPPQLIEEINKFPWRGEVEKGTIRMEAIDAEMAKLQKDWGIKQNGEVIQTAIKNGHFCVSMDIEPETNAKLKEMVKVLAKACRAAGLKGEKNDADLVWKAAQEYNKIGLRVNDMLASIGVTTTPNVGNVKKAFLQEYVETYLTPDEYKDRFDDAFSKVSTAESDDAAGEANDFRLSDFLGEDSPLIQKFRWLDDIPVMFTGAKNCAFVVSENHPFGKIELSSSYVPLEILAHEVQHAFQFFEKQGFIGYTGRKIEEWERDPAENQSVAVGDRAWFDIKTRHQAPFYEAERTTRGGQTEYGNGINVEELFDKSIAEQMLGASEAYKSQEDVWRDIGGHFNVVFKTGAENLVRFSNPKDDAARIMREHAADFIGGPLNRAAHSIMEMGFFKNQRRSIPNWLLNQVIEQKGDDFIVTLDSGVKLKAVLGGAGKGNVLKKLDEAKESRDPSAVSGEIQWEYAGDKATIPHNFVESVRNDEIALREAKAKAKGDKDALRKTLEDNGVSKLAMGKLEKGGLFRTDEVDVEHRKWYVKDFFPNDKILATAYPDIYENTEVIPYGSERIKDSPDTPLFAQGQMANLGADGRIYVNVNPNGRVRANGEVQHTLVRDIGASLIKAIRRTDGIGDDIGRSSDYFQKATSGIDFLSGKLTGRKFDEDGKLIKDGEPRKLRFRKGEWTNFGFGVNDSLLRQAMHMVVSDRFAAIEKFNKTFHFTKSDIEKAQADIEKALNAAILQSFNEFYGEREAVMFANRFGRDLESMRGIGEQMKAARDGAPLRMDDPRYTQEEKSWSYINFYGNVLRQIDKAFGSGSVEHKDRSVVRKFEYLMTEYMLNRGREQMVQSPELQALIGCMNAAALDQKTVLQRQGDSEKYQAEAVDTNNELEKRIEEEHQAELRKQEELKAINEKGLAERAKPTMIAACKKAMSLAKKCLTAKGELMPNAYAKEAPSVIAEIMPMVKECYPKWDDRHVANHTKQMMAQAITAVREKEQAETLAGRFNVTGGNVEENLIASVASKIAYEKAKHRTGNITDMADAMLENVKAQLMELGIPEADAKTLAQSIIDSAKAVATDIVAGVDATVTDAQIISQARTKAANIRVGNDIYKSFRKGYRTAIDGETAIEKARKTLERTRLRAVKRAAGYSVSEMNSMLGCDIINDLENMGYGGHYANGRELAEDMLQRFYQAYRNENPDKARATNAELQKDSVFRAEFAATISSWLVEGAKALSYGKERELAIRDAAMVKNTLPPTITELLRTVEHHADMLGQNLGKQSVESTLHDIEKLIDSRPSDGGADGGKAVSETARAYQREIAPRLQQYWKYVKKAMWFDADKVDAEVQRLQNSLNMSDADIIDIEGKKPSELNADALLKRDLAVMQINALRRYGAMKDKHIGEVRQIYMNDIAKDLAYAAQKFLSERQARLDRDAAIRKDIMEGLTKPLDEGKGFDELSNLHKWGRRYYFWNVPDLFAKLATYFKTGSEAFKHVEKFRQDVSLAHEYQMRAQAEYQKKLFTDIEEIYGESFDKFVRHACLPDAKYDRFSRSGWAVPEHGGRTVKIPTGKRYAKNLPKIGAKVGDEIYRTVTLAEAGADPTRRSKHLSMANLIYIYAACRQTDMAVNNLVYGRDAAYIADLERTIGAEGIALADRMVNNYTALRNLISPVCERITGMPVQSPNEMYIPLEFVQDKKAVRVTRYEINPYPKFLMNRKYHDAANLDESVDFLGEYIKRSEDSAHYAAFGELADTIRTTFGDDKIVTQYHNLIGSKTAGALFKQLNECFNGGIQLEDSFGVGFRNFVTATTLGYNPSSCLKQLEGIGGWAYGFGPLGWMKAITFDKVFDRGTLRQSLDDLHSSGLFQKHGLIWERSEGISEPMIMLMNAREGGTAKALNFYQKMKEAYRGHSMDMIRIFDSVASNWGAGSYYASRKRFYEVDQHLGVDDAKRLALADTDYMLQLSQQSGRPEFMHEWQRGGVGGRFLTQFAGPTLVRAGIELEAAHRHFRVERTQESFNRLFSKLIAGHVICPAILTTVSQLTSFFFGKRDDKNADLWDDFSTNLLISMAIGPLNGMLIVGQIVDATIRKAALWDSNNRSYTRRHFESPVTSKLGQLADGFVTTTMDVANTFAPMMQGQDLNPAMLQMVQDDVIRNFQQCFPILRFLNVVPNAVNYMEKLERDKRREQRRQMR